MMKVYVPRDAAARALGADAVAEAAGREIAARGLAATVVRNGTRGMVGLEPLVEIETAAGRTAFGPAPQKYVVCNADEGDSGTFADRMLMEGDPFSLIEGMAICGLSVGATRGYAYIRSEYPDAIEVMREAIRVARAHGLLGPALLGQGPAFDMEVRVGAGAYV